MRVPPLYAEEQEVLFGSLEAQFTLAGMTDKKTKFHYVLSQLHPRYAREVWDIVISLPQQDPYTKLKTLTVHSSSIMTPSVPVRP
jgi:hypothetical protein